MEYCFICGKRPGTDTHHLINGNGKRELCDEDGLTIEVCRECHTWIHNNAKAEHLCKAIGQYRYQGIMMQKGETLESARELFRKRYGKNFA